ncbi:hypothetical protein BYT27DRAFT_7186787 [Phlegmacium glaucopus]|nr:hypothetical protein BYT27DRAFT_7186787 [Phlegmacium glaucopus]
MNVSTAAFERQALTMYHFSSGYRMDGDMIARGKLTRILVFGIVATVTRTFAFHKRVRSVDSAYMC